MFYYIISTTYQKVGTYLFLDFRTVWVGNIRLRLWRGSMPLDILIGQQMNPTLISRNLTKIF